MKILSIVIITYNAEGDIQRCLESVRWADEKIIVDCFSQDKTLEIAKKYTDKIWQREWPGYAKQWNFAIEKASGNWIFVLASDESLTPELQDGVKSVLAKDTSVDGYYVPRKTYFLNHWMKYCGWYPEYPLRLFKKGKAKFKERLVHEDLDFNGKAERLRGNLLHYSFKSITDYLDRLNRYTTLEAQQMANDGIVMKNKKIVYKMLANPLTTFRRMYFQKRGFMEGRYGFMLCLLSSIYRFILFVKYWEIMQGISR